MFKHIHKGIDNIPYLKDILKYDPLFLISAFEQMMLQIREVPAWQGLDTWVKDSTTTLVFLETPEES